VGVPILLRAIYWKTQKEKARFYPRLFWIMKINGFFTSYESPFSYSTRK